MNILDTVENALKPFDAFEIGKSVCGRPVLCAHIGANSGRQIIVTAAIHARECFTATVVLRQAAEFREAVQNGFSVGGAYFVPLVNPDGALFFETGDTGSSRLLEKNRDNRLIWKANADGVDLNCNFDANWGSGRQNKTIVGASDYIGEFPLCAPESRALARFTKRVCPDATVSYHCMGGELYWEFFQDGARRRRDLGLAQTVAESIGVKRVDGHLFSAGGYKDYCVQRLKIPAVTIELIADGEHPFYEADFAPDAERNARLPEIIINYLNDPI